MKPDFYIVTKAHDNKTNEFHMTLKNKLQTYCVDTLGATA